MITLMSSLSHTKNVLNGRSKKSIVVSFAVMIMISACNDNQGELSDNNTDSANIITLMKNTLVVPTTPLKINFNVEGSLVKKVTIDVDNPHQYASISLYADDQLLIDHLHIPEPGQQKVNALVKFDQLGDVKLTLKVKDANVMIIRLVTEDVTGYATKDVNDGLNNLQFPVFKDISEQAGLDKVSSIKYAGPTIADIDNDGDYDFIVNNHNEETSKLYWNNGDGTVSKHNKNLARWFMHDLHGTAAGDYDNDGDLDLVVTQGGGNGKDPSKANFYTNNSDRITRDRNTNNNSKNNSTFVLTTGDVGIDRGGRGRGAKWTDMDLDGDLDLMLINETSLHGDKPQHFFHENLGDGTFKHKPIAGLQDQHQSRALITDLNNDNIDDVILYGPLSVWQGNGDFTFTDITDKFSNDVTQLRHIMAVVDLDIDNDGDLDLYLARGKEFELGQGEAPSVDHDPISKEFSIKPRGYKGVDSFEFTADGNLKLHNYIYLTQGEFRGKDYPIFLGSNKTTKILSSGEEIDILVSEAQGWPDDISENGAYFGHMGKGLWKSALVRNGDIFWSYRFSLSGVNSVSLDFEPENRNIADVLLINNGDSFTDISHAWNIPLGGNSLGVTTGDFNNDSHQDLFVYRWGNIGARISDTLLLNNGKGQFNTITMHGANDVGGPGNGDMGQAFDFDLDGDLDLLNGSEGGEWYLYQNELRAKNAEKTDENNFVLVDVGYSPQSHVDAISAEVIVETAHNTYRKRVGSAGAVFSQSLLNIVHFGLGNATEIISIKVKWRNGETVVFTGKQANRLYDTDKLDPTSLILSGPLSPSIKEIEQAFSIRQGSSVHFDVEINPQNADKSIVWSSSDNNVITVDAKGHVTAVGDINKAATVTATSKATGLRVSKKLEITKWYSVPVKSVDLLKQQTEVYIGDTLTLKADIQPTLADNKQLTWLSSAPDIATVDVNGVVTGISAGDVTISVASAENNNVNEEMKLTVTPYINAYIKLTNENLLKDSEFVVGGNIIMKVEYHAGSGSEVIASDEGGIRFWLRHFKSKWIPVKDTILIDERVLTTESGTSIMSISLEGFVPTADLPEGHFYQLRASFASSNGERSDTVVYPINIIEQ